MTNAYKLITGSSDEELRALSSGKIFTTLNVPNEYLQIPLSQEAKIKSAFMTPNETAQFKITPFGLNTASDVF